MAAATVTMHPPARPAFRFDPVRTNRGVTAVRCNSHCMGAITSTGCDRRGRAQADDEEELALNYEENDSAMEVDIAQRAAAETRELLAQSSPANQPAMAAKQTSLTAESHQLRNPQRLSIELERHPSQPTPACKAKTATTAKHKKKQPKGRSRSDGATRNRSRSKPRLSSTHGSDSEWKTDDDAAHPSSSSH
eukprot:jgi/Tetstr1/458130/TSEL_044622.t1